MPPRPGASGPWSIRCACGEAFKVRAEAVGKPVSCPSCRASFGLVWARDPSGEGRVPVRADAVRIPKGGFGIRCECGQTLVARREQAGKLVKCPACGRSMSLEKVKDPQTLETKIRQRKPPVPAAPKPPPAGQDILCSCGESLRITADHLGKQGQCPACGALMKLEKGRDPQTQTTELRVRLVGQAEPPPKPKKADPDEWKLSDFR